MIYPNVGVTDRAVVFLKIGLTFKVEFIKRDTRAIAQAIGEKLKECGGSKWQKLSMSR